MSRLRSNTALSLAGAVLPLVAAVWAVPRLIQGYGEAAFGVLVLLWAVVGYMGLFELGLGRTLTVKLAGLSLTQAREHPLLWAAHRLTWAAGAVGALLTLALAPVLVGSLLRVPAAQHHDALAAFVLASIGVLPTVGSAVARGILEGTNRFAQANLLRLSGGLIGLLCPALSLHAFGPSLLGAAASMVLARWLLWAGALCWVWPLRRQTVPGQTQELLRFGGWLTVSSVVGPLMVYGDRFLLGHTLGLAASGRYGAVQEMLQRLLVFPTAFTNAMLPALAAHALQEQRRVYRRVWWRFVWVMLVMAAMAAWLSGPALSWWLGEAFLTREVQLMAWCLSLGIGFNALGQLPFSALHSAGRVRDTAIFHAVQLLPYLALVGWWSQSHGLVGAAAAWTVRAAVDWLGLEWRWRTIRA